MMQIAQPALVGTSLPRQDGPDKVTGRARYAGDQTLPGMLYARLVTSPYAHALILNIDTSAALSVPGVVAVFFSQKVGVGGAGGGFSPLQTPPGGEGGGGGGAPFSLRGGGGRGRAP